MGFKLDLFFTDVVMPGAISGRQLAERAVEIVPKLRLLYTSGYTGNASFTMAVLTPAKNFSVSLARTAGRKDPPCSRRHPRSRVGQQIYNGFQDYGGRSGLRLIGAVTNATLFCCAFD
jgi:hypothetical protein